MRRRRARRSPSKPLRDDGQALQVADDPHAGRRDPRDHLAGDLPGPVQGPWRRLDPWLVRVRDALLHLGGRLRAGRSAGQLGALRPSAIQALAQRADGRDLGRASATGWHGAVRGQGARPQAGQGLEDAEQVPVVAARPRRRPSGARAHRGSAQRSMSWSWPAGDARTTRVIGESGSVEHVVGARARSARLSPLWACCCHSEASSCQRSQRDDDVHARRVQVGHIAARRARRGRTRTPRCSGRSGLRGRPDLDPGAVPVPDVGHRLVRRPKERRPVTARTARAEWREVPA